MVNVSDILNAGILIVDDQEANVRLLEQILSSAGYTRITSMLGLNPSTLHGRMRRDGIRRS